MKANAWVRACLFWIVTDRYILNQQKFELQLHYLLCYNSAQLVLRRVTLERFIAVIL